MSLEREMSVWSMEMSAPQESDPQKKFSQAVSFKDIFTILFKIQLKVSTKMTESLHSKQHLLNSISSLIAASYN